MDTRHQQRIVALQQLFSTSFTGVDERKVHGRHPIVGEIATHLKEIDALIAKHASRFPIAQLAKVDLSILRLSIYELVYAKKEPVKVIIDEAVRLSKEYSTDSSYSLINGVLGSVVKDLPDEHEIST